MKVRFLDISYSFIIFQAVRQLEFGAFGVRG